MAVSRRAFPGFVRIGLACLVLIAMIATGSASESALSPHRLAFSKRLGVDVFALPDKNGQWCTAELTLSFSLRKGSPLIEKGIAGFASRLGPLFAQTCPAAKQVKLQAYAAETQVPIGARFLAKKSDAWVASALVPGKMASKVKVTIPAAQKPPSKSIIPANYWNLLSAYGQETDPSIFDDKNILLVFAADTDCAALRRVINNEFRLAGYLKKKKAELRARAAVRPLFMRFRFDSTFGRYDMQKRVFAFDPLNANVIVRRGWSFCGGVRLNPITVKKFAFSWAPDKTIHGLPMPRTKAKALVDKMEGNRGVDFMIIAKPSFSPIDTDGNISVSFDILEASVTQIVSRFLGRAPGRLLHRYTLSELRASALKVKTKVERQKRQRDYSRLKNASLAERIAYMSDLPKLSNLNAALAMALVEKQDQTVNLVVQAGNDGTSKVSAQWPGRITMNLAKNLSAFKDGRWYAVSGLLSAKDTGQGTPLTGRLNVTSLVPCSQKMCAEAQNIRALIRQRYPNLGKIEKGIL